MKFQLNCLRLNYFTQIFLFEIQEVCHSNTFCQQWIFIRKAHAPNWCDSSPACSFCACVFSMFTFKVYVFVHRKELINQRHPKPPSGQCLGENLTFIPPHLFVMSSRYCFWYDTQPLCSIFGIDYHYGLTGNFISW